VSARRPREDRARSDAKRDQRERTVLAQADEVIE
jgi:hypothetical protein